MTLNCRIVYISFIFFFRFICNLDLTVVSFLTSLMWKSLELKDEEIRLFHMLFVLELLKIAALFFFQCVASSLMTNLALAVRTSQLKPGSPKLQNI